MRQCEEKHGAARHAKDDNTTRRRKYAICIPGNYDKATDTHSERLIFTAFTQQQWLR